ncbi:MULTISPECIES: hypothetical protein [Klebsiella]|uniref:hypothetical protein n=1 Tax=Klebsiella TaxID=570 RepID=UPI000F68B8F2|nr:MULTISPECIES: hypothetical protein [Klebsiella]EIW8614317.1 hypothetical protein [Klebsiella pneumoniae]ELI7033420.1 hypothetical protein [Klebsiella pneumoniae]ELI7038773.1 hypothetical protein [Klebsiella pneumoniae]ELI7217807.1 hypothetical protein [Klebsiella pneumoniae]MBH8477935.1 hypothetical protein [Klebsiella quasipneumoniae]
MSDNRPVPWPHEGFVSPNVDELIGRVCRFVHRSDLITQEIQPGRVTFYLEDDNRLAGVVIEPDLAEE